MAHYYASRFFADPMVSVIEEEPGVISVYAVSDHLTATPGVELVVEMRTWNSFFALKDWTYVVDIVRECLLVFMRFYWKCKIA